MYIQIISATLSSLSWWKMLMMNIVHDGDKNIGKMNQTENLVIHFWYITMQLYCIYLLTLVTSGFIKLQKQQTLKSDLNWNWVNVHSATQNLKRFQSLYGSFNMYPYRRNITMTTCFSKWWHYIQICTCLWRQIIRLLIRKPLLLLYMYGPLSILSGNQLFAVMHPSEMFLKHI